MISGHLLWGAFLFGTVACGPASRVGPAHHPLAPEIEAQTEHLADPYGEDPVLAALLPELLQHHRDRPTWTMYHLDGRLRFRGPPGLTVRVHEELPSELCGSVGNHDFLADVCVRAAGARGLVGDSAPPHMARPVPNTTMGNSTAIIRVVPAYAFGGIWAETLNGPRQSNASVHVRVVRERGPRRAVLEEVVDLIRSMQVLVSESGRD